MPPPEKALEFLAREGKTVDNAVPGRRAIVGSPEKVRAGVEELAVAYGAEEVIAVTITHDHQARRHSYELLAEAMGLEPRDVLTSARARDVLTHMTNLIYTTIDSPIGELLLVGDGERLHRLSMQGGRRPTPIDPRWERRDDAFADVRSQLVEYFDGRRSEFDVAARPRRQPVRAARVGGAVPDPVRRDRQLRRDRRARSARPSAARAVGLANGRNPVAVIVPCHRVIGADGTLTGYGGGLERKRLLLDLESGVLPLTTA